MRLIKTKKEQNKWVAKDLNKKYEINEIVKGDSIFCATGITTGDIINGIKPYKNFFHTETLVTHKSQNLVNKIQKNIYLDEIN